MNHYRLKINARSDGSKTYDVVIGDDYGSSVTVNCFDFIHASRFLNCLQDTGAIRRADVKVWV